MKIRQVATDLFHVDRRTDMAELKVTFLNFANGSKISLKAARCEGLIRINLAQDMAFVDTIMNLQIP